MGFKILSKKTPSKKTALSLRPIYCSFRTAMALFADARSHDRWSNGGTADWASCSGGVSGMRPEGAAARQNEWTDTPSIEFCRAHTSTNRGRAARLRRTCEDAPLSGRVRTGRVRRCLGNPVRAPSRFLVKDGIQKRHPAPPYCGLLSVPRLGRIVPRRLVDDVEQFNISICL